MASRSVCCDIDDNVDNQMKEKAVEIIESDDEVCNRNGT